MMFRSRLIDGQQPNGQLMRCEVSAMVSAIEPATDLDETEVVLALLGKGYRAKTVGENLDAIMAELAERPTHMRRAL